MKIFLSLLIAFMPLTSLAWQNGQVQNAPYQQELRKLIDLAAVDGQHVMRTLKTSWDFNVQGGSTTTTYNLPVYLPANAVVVRSFGYIVNPVGISSNGGLSTTMKLGCVNAGDIVSSSQTTGTYMEGVQTGSTTLFVDCGTSRAQLFFNISNTNGSSAAYKGKINYFLSYFVHE